MTSQRPRKHGFGIEDIQELYRNSPFDFGAGDIFSCGPFNTLEHVADLVFILSMVEDKDERNPITEFTVVLPPTSEHTAKDMRAAFSSAVARHRGRPLDERELEILPKRLKVVEAVNLQVRSAVTLVESAKRNSVVIVCDGGKYREEAPTRSAPAEGTIRLEEDAWVPHFHSLAVKAVAAAKQNELYVALNTGQWRPRRQANLDLLMSVDDCGLLTVENISDPDGVVAAHGDQWLADIKAGRIGSVLASIDALPDAMNNYKSALKIQMFHRAGLLPQAVELIQAEVTSGYNLSPEGRVKLALIAAEAGQNDLASGLLGPAIAELTGQELLEGALTIAGDLGETVLEEQCATKLQNTFPDSHHLQRHRLRTLLRTRDYAGMGAMLVAPPPGIDPETAAFYARLASGLSMPGKPDYQSLLADVSDHWPNRLVRARLACIRDADARGFVQDALALAMSLELTGKFAQRSAWALLHALEQLLIRRNEDGELGIHPADLDQPILALVRYLAQNPADGETRIALAKLLSVQVTGTYGLPVIAAATLKLAQETPVPTAQSAPTRQRAVGESDFSEIGPFFRAAMEWLAAQGMVVLGRTVLPETLITAPADRLIYILSRMIEHVGHRLKVDSDFTYLEKLLTVAAATAPHTSTPNIDLVLIRLVAGMYVLAGRVQRARNLVEHGLHIAAGDPRRSRIAWYGFADTYHRLNNLTESLVAMACALSCEADIGPEEAWYETHGLTRLLRDLNMASLARSLLPRGRQLLQQIGAQESQRHRLETIELGLRFREFTARTPTSEEMADLIMAIAQNCNTVIKQHDELTPAAILLGQAIRMSEDHRINVPDDASEVLDAALTELGEPNASLIRTVSARGPMAASVLSLATRLERARHSEDAAFDVRFVAISARRLLDTAEASGDAKVAAFAIELLADQAIGRYSVTNRPALPSSIEEPGETAKEISRDGISVHLLGLAESNRVARVTAEAGELTDTVYEPVGIFSKDALDAWSKQFPYRYGFNSDEPNIFYNSMRELGLTAAPSIPALLITDVALQQLPPNLLMASGEFMGSTVPMAAAPSLSWLKDVRARPARSGAPFAWIPIADVPGADQTLAILADRVNPALQAHAITLDTGPVIPAGFSGAELAIIAAHGGIIPEGRFFQVVADDADMRVTSAAISGAVRNAGIVVLFVCSAGRFDKHPMADTTTGLAKELLDRGCSAVIASPWPLNAGVPAHWLPTFLDSWSRGSPVTEANFQANKAVERALGRFPANCLAMTVFGDPLLTKLTRAE
jgi:hypothetical protein